MPFIQKSDILPGINSDHSITELVIDFSKFIRGKGFYKYNNSLNKDLEYVKLINKTISRVSKQYAECIYNPSFFDIATPEQLQDLTYTINPQLLLETLLFEIRGSTIEYCTRKKKQKNEALNLALHRLEASEKKSDKDPEKIDLLDELNKAKKIVENFENENVEAALVRARLRWQLEGEKPSKYFCNLEKYNALQKYIPKLRIKDEQNIESCITDQKSIDKELKKFYANLYKSQEIKQNGTVENFLCQKNASKLSKVEADELEGLISLEEATKYMKTCRSDASQGSSGFTGGFYKWFWRNLKNFVVNSINYAFKTNNLSLSQKLGVIILLPKPNKDKTLLSNWRPISLLKLIWADNFRLLGIEFDSDVANMDTNF